MCDRLKLSLVIWIFNNCQCTRGVSYPKAMPLDSSRGVHVAKICVLTITFHWQIGLG